MLRLVWARGFQTTASQSVRRGGSRLLAPKAPPPPADVDLTDSSSVSPVDASTPSLDEADIAIDDLLHAMSGSTPASDSATPADGATDHVARRMQTAMTPDEELFVNILADQPKMDMKRLWIDGLGMRYTHPSALDPADITKAFEKAAPVVQRNHLRRMRGDDMQNSQPMVGAVFQYDTDPSIPNDAWITSPGFAKAKSVPWRPWSQAQVDSWEKTPVQGLPSSITTPLLANGSLSRKERREFAQKLSAAFTKAKYVPSP